MNLEVKSETQPVAPSSLPIEKTLGAVKKFIEWLDKFGETSYDFQSYYASELGKKAKALYYSHPKLGILAVSPMVFSEAFVPSAKSLFSKRQRFPIADAHYAMGFAFFARFTGQDMYYKRAVHFLDALNATKCPGYSNCSWGYPFDWVTMRGTIKAGTPLITTEPYVYEAFKQVWEIDKNEEWLRIMQSTAEHALVDYKDFPTSANASTCSYTPDPDQSVGVVNANAYRAWLLTSAAVDFSEEKFRKAAERNLNFVLEAQNADGSWFYAKDGKRNFIDHFHTCFVMKALAKIEALTGHSGCSEAIKRGVEYYATNLFDEGGIPKPFSSRPRMTVYRRELYDYAECINLAVLLRGRFPKFDERLATTLKDLLSVWQKPDGAFRSRRLHLGWDNTPMHRWAQAQLFRSLCFLLERNAQELGSTTPTLALGGMS